MKDERYIWSENMDTVTKFWVKDPTLINKKCYDFLNAQMEKSGEPKRYAKTDAVALDKSKLLQEGTTSAELINHLQTRKDKIFDILKVKGYRPSDEVLQDFKMLLQQERKIYLARFKSDKKVQKEIKELYLAVYERINIEAARKSAKYSINLKELIELQKRVRKQIVIMKFWREILKALHRHFMQLVMNFSTVLILLFMRWKLKRNINTMCLF
ncbi:coiled-coil protein [Legionella sainthelensi]|nr:coiled-coil protein [Legionella sainthelensi]